jgi:RNA polymerase sigma-70 factor (family 1)
MTIKPLDNESDLLGLVALGDEYAFSMLFNHYYKPLGNFALNITKSLETAEEIVQDAFIRLWIRRETLTDIQNFGGYVYMICRNDAFLRLKKLAAEQVFEAEFERYLSEERDTEGLDLQKDEYRKWIEEAVEKLPAQQKRVYKLSRYERLKYEDIAAELGMSVLTVKTHVQRAVQFIRRDVNSRMQLGVLIVLTTPLILP